MIIPEHIQIETINGVCTSRCTMCTIGSWTRKPYRMTEKEFCQILMKFLPYKDKIKFLSLQGWGETLLDSGIVDKVKIAKWMEFSNVGFATNCTNLTHDTSMALLDAGLDTLICSVDGVRRKTHESIRVGTNYDQIIFNIGVFQGLRERMKKNTKVILRFIRQKSNESEWEEYKHFWENNFGFRSDLGDAVISFDIVDCDNKVKGFKEKDVDSNVGIPKFCEQLFDRMIIYSNGNIALCCTDDNNSYDLGNVLKDDPIEFYNRPALNYYRRVMSQGDIQTLSPCKTCTIPRSQLLKDKL